MPTVLSNEIWQCENNMFETQQLTTTSGAKLHVYHALCSSADHMPANTKSSTQGSTPVKGIVHINHGLAEHAGRYEIFAEALNKAGFHVYAHDHRGHGHTHTRHNQLGHFDSEDATSTVLADIADLHHQIKEDHPDLPLLLFGHSMGGLIAMNYALKYPSQLVGVAIWNSNFSGGILGRLGQLLLAWEKMRRGSDTPSHILPKLTFDAWGKAIKGHRTAFDWLSHKPEAVDAYIQDPLCGWNASIGMWQTIFDWVFAGSNPQALATLPKNLPFMLVGGGEDPATDHGKATKAQAARLKKAELKAVECIIYDTARHETLNDLIAEQATKDFILWANNAIDAE